MLVFSITCVLSPTMHSKIHSLLKSEPLLECFPPLFEWHVYSGVKYMTHAAINIYLNILTCVEYAEYWVSKKTPFVVQAFVFEWQFFSQDQIRIFIQFLDVDSVLCKICAVQTVHFSSIHFRLMYWNVYLSQLCWFYN